MPRKSRENSGTGIYHVMLRGINRQNIFYDIDDYECSRRAAANERTAKRCYQTGTRLRSQHPADRAIDRNQFFHYLQELECNKRTVPLLHIMTTPRR